MNPGCKEQGLHDRLTLKHITQNGVVVQLCVCVCTTNGKAGRLQTSYKTGRVEFGLFPRKFDFYETLG